MPDMAFTFTMWKIEFAEKYPWLTSSFFFHFQTTLRDLMQQHGQSSYAKSIKVKVICHSDIVHYRNDKQEDRQLLNAVLQITLKQWSAPYMMHRNSIVLSKGILLSLETVLRNQKALKLRPTQKCSLQGTLMFQWLSRGRDVTYCSLLLDWHLWQRP